MFQETEIVYNAPLTVRYSHGLPHWEVDGGIYFITFRLEDSLLRNAAMRAYKRLRARAQMHRRRGDPSLIASSSIHRVYVEEFDRQLDIGTGRCWLQKPAVARIVARAIEFYDGDEYELFAYVVMGNHVHLVFRLFKGEQLGAVMGRIKSYTAKRANDVLSRSGKLWQRGYYDCLIRTVEECQRVVEYVWNNPVKAGFDEWQWRRRYPSRTRCFV